MKPAAFAIAGLLAFATTHQATAADIPARPAYKAPVMAPIVYNWTGFYVGAHAGYGWADKDWTFLNGNTTSHTADGFLGGIQVGYNYQVGTWVFGIEGDVSWANLSGRSTCPNAAYTCGTNVDWLGTLTGRIGYAANNWLLYVKGGWAWADEDYDATGPLLYTAGHTRSGWTVGAGVEYGFTPNWSAKLEYNYMDFGSKRANLTTAAGATDPADVDQNVSVIKLGVNYRFGGPVVARY